MREQLTDRIKFEELMGTETNENGFEEDVWKEFFVAWSSKRDMSGKEFIQLGAQRTEIVTSFTVRYSLKIKQIIETYQTKVFRVIHKGNIYDIQYPYDVKNQHRFVEFKCKLVI